MESEAQKVEAIKKNAKYRRHMMKKRKHERNMAQVKENEQHRSHYKKRTEFNTHRVLVGNSRKVTSGRLSVPRGLFLKGKASSILKKTADTYLNPLNYARKKEKLGQIIKIGMDQAQKIDKNPVKRLPKGNEVANNETEDIHDAKRKKNMDRIKEVLGLADPAPSFMPSPMADVQDTQLVMDNSPAAGIPFEKLKSHEKSESPRQSPSGFDSPREVRTPDSVHSQPSCSRLEVDEKVDEMDDLFLEKLVSDIGLYAWNSQKPGSEPYQNSDERLIKEIISLRDVSLNEIAKLNKAKKAERPGKTSETITERLGNISEAITSLPPGLPQSAQHSADFKLAARNYEDQSCWPFQKQTSFATAKGKVRLKTAIAPSGSVEYNTAGDCYRGLIMGKQAEPHCAGSENSDDEPEPAGTMPLPADTSFVSPSTPPIAVHAFDPKAFMQHVEVQRKPQEKTKNPVSVGCSTGGGCSMQHVEVKRKTREKLKYPTSVGCSTGGGCSNSRPFDRSGSSSHFDRSENEFNCDDYETALSKCCDDEISGRSDDSDGTSNLYKFRRAMY